MKKDVNIKAQKVLISKSSAGRQKSKKSVSFAPNQGLASDGGAADQMKALHLASHGMARRIESTMGEASLISEYGKSSLGAILNPCGENPQAANKMFPDGTLSQSAELSFRLFEPIAAPWQNAAVLENTSNLWSLIMISPPCFATVGILVACKKNIPPTDEEWVDITHYFNANPQAVWPQWAEALEDTFYISVLKYKSAAALLGTTKQIESWRLVGDGHVLEHNTPTLWDQGALTVGQFQTDIVSANADTTVQLVTFRVQILVAGTLNISCFFRLPNGSFVNLWTAINVPTTTTNTVNALLGAGVVQNFNIDLDNGTPYARYRGVAITVGCNWNTVSQTLTIANPSTAGSPVVFTGIQPSTVGYIANRFGAISGPYVADQNVTTVINNITQWSLPPLNASDVVQADPKFSAEIMKKHGGYYAVRRFFEPVLNMTDASNTVIKLSYNDADSTTEDALFGGLADDMMDRNAASIISVIRGISYAANPTIKANRFIQAMPSPESSISPFVKDCPPLDEDAILIFRAVNTTGPHSYIPDANALGFLATMINMVVETLPVFMRGARAVGLAVAHAVEYVEANLFSKIPQV